MFQHQPYTDEGRQRLAEALRLYRGAVEGLRRRDRCADLGRRPGVAAVVLFYTTPLKQHAADRVLGQVTTHNVALAALR